jgi:hypothetical protein
VIEAEGPPDSLERFADALVAQAPPLARVADAGISYGQAAVAAAQV